MMHKSLRHIRSRYRITLDDYAGMWEAQAGLCAACGQPPQRGGRSNANGRLFIDHDHATDAVRGLLCQGCNAAVGLAGDDPVVLRALADYLERPPSIPVDRLITLDKGRRMRERTECKNGHPYTADNTKWRRLTGRVALGRECRTCARGWNRKKYLKRRAARVTELT